MKTAGLFLSDLIALPSVNPAFLPANDPRGGESRVAEYLEAAARSAGFDVTTQSVFPGRNNVLITFTPVGKVRRRILLAPHMDTVGDNSAKGDLFQPRVVKGRLFGRGACDTKGSIAAMFTALQRLVTGGQRPKETEVVLAALVDEENEQSGSRALVRSGFKADLGIVGEPTLLAVVTAHKGDLWLELETKGRAAHGSRPELGQNAVHQMARVVDLLETRYAKSLSRSKHPLLGSATVNVGSIRGGRQPNIVPDRCIISVDRRTIPGERDPAVRREIKKFLTDHGLEGVALRDFKDAAPCPPLETNLKLPLVKQLLEIAGQPRPMGVSYFSDAAVIAAGGTPCVVFGPGDIAQAHTASEWISLRQLEMGAQLLERFLRSQP